MRPRRLVPLLLLLAVSLGVALAFANAQAIRDWLQLRDYTPPAIVKNLADETSMTAEARHLFYVNHPQVQDRDVFAHSCSNHDEQTIVLGCYHPPDNGIYLFDVSDARLAGVEQVTAAHEMLHAAHDRLSASERTRVDGLLEAYNETLTDSRLRGIIDAYRRTEPNDLANEMHSIFGTEVKDLPDELETYYKQYFGDRQLVTSFATQYQAEFTSRQAQVDKADAQLQAWQDQIDTNNAELERQEAQITAQRAQLERDRASGNIDAYNAAVPVYNGRINTYNALITTSRNLIEQYNQLVVSRNEIAIQVNDLAKAINSNPQTIAR